MFPLTDEQTRIQEAARRLAEHEFAPLAAGIDRSEAYPFHNVEKLKQAGFLGMTIPTAYGGAGLDVFEAVLVIEQIARACGVTGRIVVESNLGALGAIMAYGSEAQKRLAADLVLAGDKPAICITEPGAGSAAGAMTTRAVRRGDRWVLNGTKHWITGGGISRLHLIFARLVENGAEGGIGAFLAVRDEDAGLRIGRREPTMGLRGIPETEVILEDLDLPLDRALLPAGGFKDLMRAYNGQRLGAAAVALGIGEGAFDLARGYALARHQFGRPIAEFQGLQWMLADMSIGLAAAQALIYKAAAQAGSGFPSLREAAEAKIMAAETAVRVTNDALQIHGAAGYSRDLPLERMVRDARMFTIGGGTAQVLRTQVAGAILGIRVPQTRGGRQAAPGAARDDRGGADTAAA